MVRAFLGLSTHVHFPYFLFQLSQIHILAEKKNHILAEEKWSKTKYHQTNTEKLERNKQTK